MGSASKQKWLHALALTPAAEMEATQLQAVPPGTTPEPYAAAAVRRRKREAESAGDGAQDWRWQERGKRPRAPAAAPSLGRADIPRDRRRTIFVRNVPFAASEATIIEFFSQAGKVEDLVRKTNDQGMRMRGFMCFGDGRGFLEQYPSEDAARDDGLHGLFLTFSARRPQTLNPFFSLSSYTLPNRPAEQLVPHPVCDNRGHGARLPAQRVRVHGPHAGD